jgi:hypothetical protein
MWPPPPCRFMSIELPVLKPTRVNVPVPFPDPLVASVPIAVTQRSNTSYVRFGCAPTRLTVTVRVFGLISV